MKLTKGCKISRAKWALNATTQRKYKLLDQNEIQKKKVVKIPIK